jgi:hypothetical protein
MTDNTRPPPADLEYKGAASMLAPRPGVAAPATGTVAARGRAWTSRARGAAWVRP